MNVRYCFLVVGLMLISCSGNAAGCSAVYSSPDSTAPDTLRVKAGMIVILMDSFYVATQDTVLITPDKKIRLRKDPYTHSRSFYDSLAVHAGRRKMISGLYKVFIRDNAPVNITEKNSCSREDELAVANGKIIRSMGTFNVPLLDGDVRDTAWVARSFLSRLMSFHPQTRSELILTSALPQPGEMTDGESLADAERLVRAMPGIRDAELYILPSSGPDSIDVVIVTQDVFPINASVGIKKTEKFVAALSDNNIDGRALELGAMMVYRPQTDHDPDYRFTLRKANVMRSFGDFQAESARLQQRKEHFLSFDRGYLTEDLPDLGGFKVGQVSDRIIADSSETRYQRLQLSAWYGHVFRWKNNWNVIPTVSAEAFGFIQRPRTESVAFALRDRFNVLGSIHMVRREFIRTALVTRFGVSEYFPVGEGIQLTAGRERIPGFGRNYLSAGISFARFIFDVGYIGATCNTSAFYRTNSPEDITLRAGLDYFSPLLKWGRVRFRQFASVRYQSLQEQHFLSPFALEDVRLDPAGNVNTTQRYFVYGLQTIWHMPWYVYGFRFAFYEAFEAYNVEVPDRKKWIPTVSAGVRIRNEYLVYSTFAVQLQWQPQQYGFSELYSVKFTTMLPQVFSGLGIGKPTLPY